MNRDITESEKIMEALKESDEVMRYIIRKDPNPVVVLDDNLYILALSDSFLIDYNSQGQHAIGKHFYEVFPEIPQRWREVHQRGLQGIIQSSEDDYFERVDGSAACNRWECRPWYRLNGETGGIILYPEVTTERKNAEKALKDNEEKYHYIFTHNPQPMWIYDLETLAFLEVNEAAIHHYGYSKEEFMHMSLRDIRPQEDLPILYENIKSEPSSENPPGGWRHVKKNGEVIYVEISAHSVFYEGRKARHILINDITKRKLAEEKLLHMTRLYAFLSQINQAIVQTKNTHELFNRICKVAIEHGQFRMAWVGWANETDKKLKPFAIAGHDEGYVTQTDISTDNSPAGQGPTGTAFREGRIITCPDIATDPKMELWKEEALQRGYHSLAAVPLKCRAKIVGTLTLYSKDSGFFTNDEQKLLGEIGDDISFALEAIATEEDNKLAQMEAQRLRQAMDLINAHVYIKDLQLRYVYANKHSLGLFGCSMNELIGNDDSRFFPPEAVNKIMEIDKRVLQGEETSEELDINDPIKGRRVYWEVKVPVYANAEDHTISGLLGISTDITERKLTEEQLRLSEERYRELYDNAKIGIYRTTPDGNIQMANKTLVKMLGYTSFEELALTNLNHAEYKKSGRRDEFLQVFNHSDEISNWESEWDRRDGYKIYMRESARAIRDDQGKILYFDGFVEDITDRKLAEHALHESENHFRTLVQTIPDLVWVKDLNGAYIQCNPMFERYSGLSEAELIGKTDFDLADHDQAEYFHTNDRIALEAGKPVIFEEWVTFADDGRKVFLETIKTPMFDSKGMLIGILGIGHDITNRKIAQEALRESEIKYRAFFESSIDGILLTDAAGNTLAVNPAACNMFGYTEEEMIKIGKKGLENPDDDRLTAFLDLRNINGRAQGEVSFRRKDGTSFPAEISSSLIINNDNTIRSSVIIRDISERKRNHETVLKLSRAVDQTVEAIVITDKDGKIEYVNHAYEDLTGYTLKEVMGRTPSVLKSGKHPVEFYQQLWATILSGNVSRNEVINKKKSGELFLEQKTISPIFDENRNITHFIGTGVDITERKIAEKELIKAKEKAEESDRLKSAFLANMSHEVRTPLNSILGFSSLLEDPDFDADQRKEFIHHILLNGNNLLNIISDIMDISKIESGEIKIQKHPVDACQFVTTIKHQFALQAEEKKLELKLTIPSNKETIVYADPDRLNQVIINLISNALKFTKEGSIEIGYLPKADQVLFFVIDTGIGIPAEYHQKIFERFRQVEMEKTRKYGGNGLGLAITKNLVELMDGHIWLQSEPGKGSAFYFTLPVYKEKLNGL
ncbi:MAG: PAS domain S-box protein [Candidatus Saccharibacteria bacterium]